MARLRADRNDTQAPSTPPELSTGGANGYDVIHARLLLHFPALVEEMGGDPSSLLATVDLASSDCERSDAVNSRQWLAVLALAAGELGAPDFGLRLAQRQGGAGIYGPLGTAMRHAHTLGEALAYVASHVFAHSAAARVWQAPAASGRHVLCGHEILVGSLSQRSQAIEQVLLLGHLGAREMTGGATRARRVHLRHGALSDAATYRRHFGCEVRFCSDEDALAFTVQDLARPIRDRDPQAFRHADALIERLLAAPQPPVSAQVRSFLLQHLSTGASGSEDVATALGLHPRTLHRRLATEGASFQIVKDAVRRETMLYYLRETDLELARISEKLGFAEQSALSHFARANCGASPSEFRACG